MEIFFSDPDAVPLPPEEVRILDLQATPYPNGQRVRVELEITPFQKRPSGELLISTKGGTPVASLNFIETIEARMQFTLHLRGKDPDDQYTLAAVLYYLPEIDSSPDEPEEETGPIGDPEVIDRREVQFLVTRIKDSEAIIKMPIDLPGEYLHRMQDLLKGEYGDFLAAYEHNPQTGLRVNNLKTDSARFREISPWRLSPVPWCSTGFLVHGNERPGKHPYFAAGLYYLQEPSAMAVAELMAPKPGERILDLAAAPGGKATHLAALMGNSGFLLANDMNQRRVRYLVNNFERWGASNVAITQERPHRLADHFGASFDRVLLDAPCSGEGMFRKEPTSVQMWSQKLIRTSAERQINLLTTAAKLVSPDGQLVYTTCTFNPDENEAVVSEFIKSHPNFELVELPRIEGFNPGRPLWIDDGEQRLNRAVRIWPHQSVGEGHFIAVLHRLDGEDLSKDISIPERLVGKDRKLLDDFWLEHMTTSPPTDWRLSLQGNRVYLIRDDSPDLRGLNVLHWGVWLGTLKKDRFEPAHPMVMTLPEEMFKQNLDLGSDSEDVRGYLRADMLNVPGPPGWIRVSVDGYALGWGKRVGDRVKSRAPRWLRNIY